MWMDCWALEIPFKYWFQSPEGCNSDSNRKRALFRCFPIQRSVVVLSNSNDVTKEVFENKCLDNKIEVLRRKGGGGTVLLGPGTVVLTLAFNAKDLFQNSRYFSLINSMWAESIKKYTGLQLIENGYSDLTYKEKKIVGTSLFRSKNFLLYQGSLLVDADYNLMNATLKHPSREPSYRKGRTHSDFLTTLKNEGYEGTPEELSAFCQTWFHQNFFSIMDNHFY